MQIEVDSCSAGFRFLWTEYQEADAVYHQNSFATELQETKTQEKSLLSETLLVLRLAFIVWSRDNNTITA